MMNCENDNDNSDNRPDDGALCKCVCSRENFADDEELRKHICEKHLKSFKIILSRLDLKSFNRIPNKENAFKLTKFDRNVIPPHVRDAYRLDDFYIEIERHKLRDDCAYKVVENHDIWFDMNLVPECDYTVPTVPVVLPDYSDGVVPMPISMANTLYIKRKIENLLATRTPRPVKPKPAPKPKPAAVPKRVFVGSSEAAAAYFFNGGGKQKKLMSRGRRDAARRKPSVNGGEFDSSSDDDVAYDERRPLASYQNTAPALDSLNDHFMAGLARFPQVSPAAAATTTSRCDQVYSFSSAGCSVLQRRTVTTTQKTTNPGAQRHFAPRANSSSGPYTMVNQQTVTMSQNRATFGSIGARPAFNAQICRQSSLKVTKRVTTYPAEPSARIQPVPASRPTTQNVAKNPAPQAVISLLSDSDDSAVEIVESEPAAAAPPDNAENEVYILPT